MFLSVENAQSNYNSDVNNNSTIATTTTTNTTTTNTTTTTSSTIYNYPRVKRRMMRPRLKTNQSSNDMYTVKSSIHSDFENNSKRQSQSFSARRKRRRTTLPKSKPKSIMNLPYSGVECDHSTIDKSHTIIQQQQKQQETQEYLQENQKDKEKEEKQEYLQKKKRKEKKEVKEDKNQKENTHNLEIQLPPPLQPIITNYSVFEGPEWFNRAHENTSKKERERVLHRANYDLLQCCPTESMSNFYAFQQLGNECFYFDRKILYNEWSQYNRLWRGVNSTTLDCIPTRISEAIKNYYNTEDDFCKPIQVSSPTTTTTNNDNNSMQSRKKRILERYNQGLSSSVSNNATTATMSPPPPPPPFNPLPDKVQDAYYWLVEFCPLGRDFEDLILDIQQHNVGVYSNFSIVTREFLSVKNPPFMIHSSRFIGPTNCLCYKVAQQPLYLIIELVNDNTLVLQMPWNRFRVRIQSPTLYCSREKMERFKKRNCMHLLEKAKTSRLSRETWIDPCITTRPILSTGKNYYSSTHHAYGNETFRYSNRMLMIQCECLHMTASIPTDVYLPTHRDPNRSCILYRKMTCSHNIESGPVINAFPVHLSDDDIHEYQLTESVLIATDINGNRVSGPTFRDYLFFNVYVDEKHFNHDVMRPMSMVVATSAPTPQNNITHYQRAKRRMTWASQHLCKTWNNCMQYFDVAHHRVFGGHIKPFAFLYGRNNPLYFEEKVYNPGNRWTHYNIDQDKNNNIRTTKQNLGGGGGVNNKQNTHSEITKTSTIHRALKFPTLSTFMRDRMCLQNTNISGGDDSNNNNTSNRKSYNVEVLFNYYRDTESGEDQCFIFNQNSNFLHSVFMFPNCSRSNILHSMYPSIQTVYFFTDTPQYQDDNTVDGEKKEEIDMNPNNNTFQYQRALNFNPSHNDNNNNNNNHYKWETKNVTTPTTVKVSSLNHKQQKQQQHKTESKHVVVGVHKNNNDSQDDTIVIRSYPQYINQFFLIKNDDSDTETITQRGQQFFESVFNHRHAVSDRNSHNTIIDKEIMLLS